MVSLDVIVDVEVIFWKASKKRSDSWIADELPVPPALHLTLTYMLTHITLTSYLPTRLRLL